MKSKLSYKYWNSPDKLKELKDLCENPEVTMKAIQNKYGFSRQRLYQIIQQYNLPRKYKTVRESWGKKYNDPRVYLLHRSLCERKRYLKSKGVNEEQTATVDDLLVNGKVPEYCCVFGIKLNYDSKGLSKDDCVSIDKIDNTKGYIKGNVCVISFRANKIKNNGTIDEHIKIVEYMKSKLS